MKMNTLVVTVALALGGLSLGSPPVAQAHDCCQGNHDCCHGHHGCPRAPVSDVQPPAGPEARSVYDPDTVTTLRGTANAVTVVPARGGRIGGLHVTLESDGQTMDVHLGPTWFLDRAGFAVVKGDVVEVTGSLIDSDGASFLIARELTKGQKILKLRDERGIPVWAGSRRP